MKKRTLVILSASLILPVLAACSPKELDRNLDAAEEKIDTKLDILEDQIDTLEDTIENQAVPSSPLPDTEVQTPPQVTDVQTPDNNTTVPNTAQLTKEKAEEIALTHAKLSASDVTRLHTEYEIDDGIPEYEVDFHYGKQEYDYTIHAETGEILSYDVDYD